MAQKSKEQRMFDIGAEEMWTPFLEEVNDLMVEEKAARHENDHIKNAEICVRIVSITVLLWLKLRNLVESCYLSFSFLNFKPISPLNFQLTSINIIT